MWGSNPIYNGVMTVVKSKIAEAEERHATRCTEIDTRCKKEHEEVDARAETDKQSSIDQEVKSILGKLF